MTPYFSYKYHSEYSLLKAEIFSIESNLEANRDFTILVCGRIRITRYLKNQINFTYFNESVEKMVRSIAWRYEEIKRYREGTEIEIIHLDKFIQSHLGEFLQ